MSASIERPIGSETSSSAWSDGTKSIAPWALVMRNWQSIMWPCGWWLSWTKLSLGYSRIQHRRRTHTLPSVRLTNEKQSLGGAYVRFECSGCGGTCHRVASQVFEMLWHLASGVSRGHRRVREEAGASPGR